MMNKKPPYNPRSGPGIPQASGASINMPRQQPNVGNKGSMRSAQTSNGKSVQIRTRARRGA